MRAHCKHNPLFQHSDDASIVPWLIKYFLKLSNTSLLKSMHVAWIQVCPLLLTFDFGTIPSHFCHHVWHLSLSHYAYHVFWSVHWLGLERDTCHHTNHSTVICLCVSPLINTEYCINLVRNVLFDLDDLRFEANLTIFSLLTVFKSFHCMNKR